MKNLKIVTIAFMIILGFSCENDLNNAPEFLIGKKWILLGFLNNETKVDEFKPDNLKEMNIEFSDNNRFHAVSSCNYFHGYYLINHHYIKIDSLFSTEIYCINDTIRTWEEKYFNGLKNAATFNFTGDTLAIKTNSNIEMIFRAE